MLDIFSTVLSGGLATHEIGKLEDEYNLSQIYVVIDVKRTGSEEDLNNTLNAILSDLTSGELAEDFHEIIYPGARALRTRKENIKNGIQLDEAVWEEVLAL
jgi:3-dehydro-L-gulonate 2-dehydrogenase